MSTAASVSFSSALRYNLVASKELRWGYEGGLPEKAIEAFPGLKEDPRTKEFYFAVKAAQKALSTSEDGKLGMGTLRLLQKRFAPVDTTSDYIVWNGQRKHINLSSNITSHAFDSDQGFDLHPWGHFSRRRVKTPRSIVLHWGGLDNQHLFNVMSSHRKVSTHFFVGTEEGRAVIHQVLDLNHKAWHCGAFNDHSIGIDLARQPEVKWADHYNEPRTVENTTGRGPDVVLPLPHEIAVATNQLIQELCSVFDIPLVYPEHHKTLGSNEASQYKGILGHHHLSKRKWDCACWWDTLFPT